MEKPSWIFDREREWQHLTNFAKRVGKRTQFGVVSGRRRQGKTYLLQALTQATGGMYFGATQATETDALGQFSAALARYLNISVPPRFENWDEAISYVFSQEAFRQAPIVIDEFPYLSRVSPALPSIMQREIDRTVAEERGPSLLLCGSAISVMGQLLSGNAPLRGRANVELVLRPFDYRLAADYWQITDPKLAALTHAVVGGTPAYREFIDGDRPSSQSDFPNWVLRTVLNPGTPLFLEARYQLAEEIAELRENSLYHSVLAAVAAGKTTRGAIGSYIGRKATDLTHYLNMLEDTGLLERDEDAFRSGRATYRITEPLIAFYEVVARPQWGQLESGGAAAVWADAESRFNAQVMGPHFQALCRRYALLAPPEVFGALPGEVSSGVVADPHNRRQIEVDVAVFAPTIPGQQRRILSLGEVKWGRTMGLRDVERLRRARDLLTARGFDTSHTRLTCYSAAGFDSDLLDAAGGEIHLVSLPELYGAD